LGTSLLEIGYLYDIGDNSQHRIIVEGIKPAEAGKSYPQFLSGERRCPHEDCGGPPAIFEFIENIASKRSKKTKVVLNADDIDQKPSRNNDRVDWFTPTGCLR
jgi:hypothetical protein